MEPPLVAAERRTLDAWLYFHRERAVAAPSLDVAGSHPGEEFSLRWP
jgi:hypothetical protein